MLKDTIGTLSGYLLGRGNYTITVEPVDNANELADLDALIELSSDARSSDLED
jgi:hypothetical protein